MTPQRPPRRSLWMLALASVLALTFWLYTRPEFVVQLADQLWACF